MKTQTNDYDFRELQDSELTKKLYDLAQDPRLRINRLTEFPPSSLKDGLEITLKDRILTFNLDSDQYFTLLNDSGNSENVIAYHPSSYEREYLALRAEALRRGNRNDFLVALTRSESSQQRRRANSKTIAPINSYFAREVLKAVEQRNDYFNPKTFKHLKEGISSEPIEIISNLQDLEGRVDIVVANTPCTKEDFNFFSEKTKEDGIFFLRHGSNYRYKGQTFLTGDSKQPIGKYFTFDSKATDKIALTEKNLYHDGKIPFHAIPGVYRRNSVEFSDDSGSK